jgi:hypothetical protein
MVKLRAERSFFSNYLLGIGGRRAFRPAEIPIPASGPLYYRLETKGALTPAEKIRGWDRE